MIPKINTVIVDNVYPELNGGQYMVKRTVGDTFHVQADIFSHGHDVVKAVLRIRKLGEKDWTEIDMIPLENDRWKSSFVLNENTTYEYTLFAWRDPFLSWAEDLEKKHNAGQDITSELLEGKKLINTTIKKANKKDAHFLQKTFLQYLPS